MDQIMDLLKQQQVSSSGGGPTTPKITPSSRGATPNAAPTPGIGKLPVWC
jgi:hypothetical protein